MRRHSIIFLLLLSLVACGSKQKQAAEQLLQEAQALVQSENYEDALVLLDSLQKTYPDLVELRRSAFELSKDVRIAIGHRDSLVILPALSDAEAKADSLYQEFVLIEAPDMPEENILRFRGYDPSINASSPFMDCYVCHDGQMKLVAGISATMPLESTHIRVYDSKKERFEVSDTIPYDGGLNYRYEYLSRYYERLTFSKEATVRLASFITNEPEYEQLRVVFYNDDDHEVSSFTLNSKAKEAIRGTYEYYSLLQQMLEMDAQLQQHEKRLQQRIQSRVTK